MDNEKQTSCPSCSTKIYSGILSSNAILNSDKIEIINEVAEDKKDAYCGKCGNDLLSSSINKLRAEKDKIIKEIQENIHHIPVITIHTPFGWDYKVVKIVTGQSTTGTGVLSEFTSSFTDFFGVQSNMFNKKLKGGEDFCASQLRLQAVDAGANAIIATDIDYSEVGGGKGMLMVCMSGTAVKLNNVDILGNESIEAIKNIEKLNDRLKRINTFQLGVF